MDRLGEIEKKCLSASELLLDGLIEDAMNHEWFWRLYEFESFRKVRIVFQTQEQVACTVALFELIAGTHIQQLEVGSACRLDLSSLSPSLARLTIDSVAIASTQLHLSTFFPFFHANTDRLAITAPHALEIHDDPAPYFDIPNVSIEFRPSGPEMWKYQCDIVAKMKRMRSLHIHVERNGSIISTLARHPALDQLESLILRTEIHVDDDFRRMIRGILARTPRLHTFELTFMSAPVRTIYNLIRYASTLPRLRRLKMNYLSFLDYADTIKFKPMHQSETIEQIDISLAPFEALAEPITAWMATLPSLTHLTTEMRAKRLHDGPEMSVVFPKLSFLHIMDLQSWCTSTIGARQIFSSSLLTTLILNGCTVNESLVPKIDAPLRELNLGFTSHVSGNFALRVLGRLSHPECLEALSITFSDYHYQDSGAAFQQALSRFGNLVDVKVGGYSNVAAELRTATCAALCGIRSVQSVAINLFSRFAPPNEDIPLLIENLPILRQITLPDLTTSDQERMMRALHRHEWISKISLTAATVPPDVNVILTRNNENADRKYTSLLDTLLPLLRRRSVTSSQHF